MMSKDSYLVLGGCGFVGKTIVDMLLARGETDVAVFDVVQRDLDSRARFFSGDICDRPVLDDAIRKTNASCIIHTVSVRASHDQRALFQKVNVEGTQNVVDACIAHEVKKLVYNSSSGVVFDGTDVIDGDERLPFPEKPVDPYHESKGQAERLVLEANGKGELLTVALRPSGTFGPGDTALPKAASEQIADDKTHIQIGSNNNLVDWTYVDNVAHAHLLAADKLSSPGFPIPPETIKASPLKPIELTNISRRVPTSLARPAVQMSPEVGQQDTLYFAPEDSSEVRPVARSRYDPLSDNALQEEYLDVSPLQVAGQAFFITNGEPIYFWDFFRTLWKEMGSVSEKPVRRVPKDMAMALGGVMEWVCWALWMGEPKMSRFVVLYTCAARWHNIEKARRVLGYEPVIGVEEGIRRTARWWKESQHVPSN